MASAAELSAELQSQISSRRAGSDAERRAAVWARDVLAGSRRPAELETFWCRPNWAGAQAWHIILAVIGSLLATTHARVGGSLVLLALLAMLGDWALEGRSPGRWLTRERASQNVVSRGSAGPRVRLIVTANLDTARLDPDHGGRLPGWLFATTLLTLWALLVAVARIEGHRSTLIAALQLIPTVALVLIAAGLLLGARSADNAGGVAAALALVRLLDVAPPAHLGVDVVLAGAGVGDGLGLSRYLRRHRDASVVTNTVVLGLRESPVSGFLDSDGPLAPTPFFARLRELAATDRTLTPQRAHSCSPALPARRRRLPALTLTGPADQLVEAALTLVDAIDAEVGSLTTQGSGQGDGPQRRWRDGARLRRPRL